MNKLLVDRVEGWRLSQPKNELRKLMRQTEQMQDSVKVTYEMSSDGQHLQLE